MNDRDDLEWRLALHLRPTEVPAAGDTWRRIVPRLDGAGARPWSPLALTRAAFALAATVALLLAAGIARYAASPPLTPTAPALRIAAPGSSAPTPAVAPATVAPTEAAVRSGIAGTGNRITSLQPPPPFQVLQPTYLPPDMVLVVQAYNPGPAASGQSRPSASSVAARADGNEVDPTVVAAATQRAQQLLGDGREAALVLIYAGGPDAFVELVQRPANGRQLPGVTGPGTPDGEVVGVPVRNVRAVAAQRDGRDVLSWIDVASPSGATSFVEVATTMGRAEALRVAGSLQQTALATAETLRDVSTPPAWLSVPLAQRRGTVAVPAVDRGAIAARCGPWDPTLYATAPPSSYQQAICAARVVAGVDERGNAGLSRHEWRVAAERLGLDPAGGPPDNPTVWLAQIDVSDSGGSVVILDADTGEPYLLVELQPIP